MGSDNESSHGGRDVANHTPPVASSVLHHDIAGRQHQLRAIVKLYYYVTGEKDPEMYRSAARRQRHRGSDPTCGRLRYTEN